MKQRVLERARSTVDGFLHRQCADTTLGVLSVKPEVDDYDEVLFIRFTYDDSNGAKGLPDSLAQLRSVRRAQGDHRQGVARGGGLPRLPDGPLHRQVRDRAARPGHGVRRTGATWSMQVRELIERDGRMPVRTRGSVHQRGPSGAGPVLGRSRPPELRPCLTPIRRDALSPPKRRRRWRGRAFPTDGATRRRSDAVALPCRVKLQRW